VARDYGSAVADGVVGADGEGDEGGAVADNVVLSAGFEVPRVALGELLVAVFLEVFGYGVDGVEDGGAGCVSM
jgi:hypothetical protein